MRTKRVIRVCLFALALIAGSTACTSPKPTLNAQPATSGTSPTSTTPTSCESTAANGAQVEISEMNSEGGGWNRVTTRTAPASSFKYIY